MRNGDNPRKKKPMLSSMDNWGGFNGLRGRFLDWIQSVNRKIKDRPGRSVAIALGAGYVVGGGLFSPLTARIVATGVRVGLRFAAVPLITQGLMSAGQGFLSPDEDASSEGDDAAESPKSGSKKVSTGSAGHPHHNKETHS